jgi:hypothetical protein
MPFEEHLEAWIELTLCSAGCEGQMNVLDRVAAAQYHKY